MGACLAGDESFLCLVAFSTVHGFFPTAYGKKFVGRMDFFKMLKSAWISYV